MEKTDIQIIEDKITKEKEEKKAAKKSERKKKKKAFWADFKKFIARGNVVDMAIGVAVATAFTAIVKAFTNGFISPILALLGNSSDMSNMKWIIRPAVYEPGSTENILEPEVAILWGSFLQAIFDFLIIAFTFFIILKTFTKLKARADKIASEIKKITAEESERKRIADEKKAKEEAAAAEAEAKAKAAAEAAEAEIKKKTEAEFFANISEQNELLKKIKELLETQK